MKKIKLVVFALLLCIVLPKSILALEGPFCEVYESGNEVVTADLVNDFENNLKQIVMELNKNNGEGFLITYKYDYAMSIETEIKEEKTNSEIVHVDNRFTSEEEAISYFNDIDLPEPFIKGTYNITPLEIPRIITGEGKEIICKNLECLEEITKLKEQLEKNQKLNTEVIVNDIIGDEEKQIEYKENNEVKYFDTEDEALLFAKNYVPTVLDGYEFINNDYAPVTLSVKVLKTYAQLKGNDLFDTEAEALEKLEEFQREYNTNNGEVESVRETSKDTTDRGTITFDSKEELEKWISNNAIGSELGKLTTNVIQDKEKYDEATISGEYATSEEAYAAIESLKEQGYIVKGNVDEVRVGITGEVLSGKSYPSNSRYEFPINETNFVLIKQGSGHYAVWTEQELTEEEKNVFVTTYNTVNSGTGKFDGSTTGISKNDISWIYGFKSFDLTSIGSNWGTYTFSKEGNNIVLTCKADKVSHVIKGYATEKVKFVLSGTKYKEKDIYKLDYSKLIYGFLYKINASVLVDENINKYMVISNFKKLEKIATLKYSVDTTIFDRVYELSYEKYSEEITEIANINWEITRCKYSQGNGNIDIAYPEPPQTGININLSIIINYILISFTIFTFFKAYKLLKHN